MALLMLFAPLVPAAHASPAAPAEDGQAVAVRLLSLSPEVTRPADTLSVVVEIQNTSSVPVVLPVASLSVSRYPYATRTALDAWETSAPSDPLGSPLTTVELAEPLAPGATTTVTLETPAATMKLGTGVRGWGPRGIAVTVTDAAAVRSAASPLGVLRTYVVWFPVEDTEVQGVNVSVLVPVVGPPVDPFAPEEAAEAMAEDTAPFGRLGRLLTSTQDVPGISYAVDPRLATMDDPVTSDSVSAWSAALLAQTLQSETYALPRYDQDWGALSDADAPIPARDILPTTLSSWRADLAWPAETAPDRATVAASVAARAPLVVVGPGALAPDRDLSYTPNGISTIETEPGRATALVPDLILSTLLEDPPQATPAAARQRLLAELAVIARERPSDARNILLTVPRDWDPTPAMAQAQLSALSAVPWARVAPVSELAGATDTDVDRSSLPEPTTTDGELPRTTIANLRSTRADAATYASVVSNPSGLLDPVDEAILAVSSIAWRDEPAGRSDAVAAISTYTESLRTAISVLNRSGLTIISADSRIPVELRNALPQDATIIVALDPDDPRLAAERVTVTVPAQSDATVRIPVKALGSAYVNVDVQILTADGALVAEPLTLGVRVRADWENRGTAVVTALLVLLLGGGIWRTIHRGRSDRRASAAAVEKLAQLEQTGELAVVLEEEALAASVARREAEAAETAEGGVPGAR